MMNVSALFLLTGLACLLMAGYRAVLRIRGPRKPSDIPLMVSSTALGLAFIVISPVAQVAESAITPSLGRLLSNVCTLVAAFGFLHLMLFTAYPAEQVPAKARTRLIALLIAISAMTVLFFASTPPDGIGVFAGLYRSQPTLAAYTLIYSIYLGSAIVDLGRLALHSIRYTRTWLRLGMILIAIGCLLGTAYLAQKVIAVLNELITNSSPAESICPSAFATVGCTFAIGIPAIAMLSILLGATLPTLGLQAERLFRAISYRRSYQRLGPLWDILHEALPELTLAVPDFPSNEVAPGISERLYRRVIAIRDGLLALQPYRDPTNTRKHRDLADRTGLAGPHRAAAIEAADIRAALHRRQHARAPAFGGETTAAPQNDLSSEIRWLTQVSGALVRDEIHAAGQAASRSVSDLR